MHTLPKLEYTYDALEPFIDSKTLEIHHDKHHQAYIDKLNSALEKHPKLFDWSIEELITNLDKVPSDIKEAVRNFGGGHLNHSFFWKILKIGTKPSDFLIEKIEDNFSSFEKFKEAFKKSALEVFGSGWTWLVLKAGKLKIVNTKNQDSPLTDGLVPVLVIDMWEHAYYLKYMNKKADFVDAFFNIINWGKVEELIKVCD